MSIFWIICIVYLMLHFHFKKEPKKAQKAKVAVAKPTVLEKITDMSKKDTITSKEKMFASCDKMISDIDKMLEVYRVDYLKVESGNTDDGVEYMLTNINSNLNKDFDTRFILDISDSNKPHSKLHILFQKDKSLELEVFPFDHSIKNFSLLDKPIKRWKNNHYEYVFAKSKVDEICSENFDGEIPYWEHKYIYSSEQFPSAEIKRFYNFFKSEFMKENYIDLKGNTNYSFYLMFDILKMDNQKIKKYLPLLSLHYPEMSRYCHTEMGKRGICSMIHNGEEYYEYSNNIYASKKDFWRKEQILYWLSSTGEFSSTGMTIFVNENGIDGVINESISLYGTEKRGCKVLPIGNRLPDFIKFGTIEGNFTFNNVGWNSVKNLMSSYKGGQIDKHKIVTLEGCPKIVKGNFKCEGLDLDTLVGGPIEVGGDYICKKNNISSFVGMPKYIGGCFNIANNDFTDEAWEYAKENIDAEFGDYNISRNKFVKYRKELS